MVKIVGEVFPWLRNVYPYKAWLNDVVGKAPVKTPYGIFYLGKGECKMLPKGLIVGRYRVCGKPVTATIRRPRICWVYDCAHFPYTKKPRCPGTN